MNLGVKLFVLKTRPEQAVFDGENVAPDDETLNILSRALKVEHYEEWSDDTLAGGDLGNKHDKLSNITYIYKHRGGYDSPSIVFLRMSPEDTVSLIEALKAEK